jgi:putative two-component system response regulator
MGEKMKDVVMIVDDLITNRLMLATMLEDKYNILEAENGDEAVKMLGDLDDDQLPSVILLDIMMPGIDGFGVIRYIKSNEKLRSIPVLFITAADDEETEIKGLKAGALDYIHKPFTTNIVKLRVENAITIFNYQTKLEKMVDQKTKELVEKNEKMLESLATIIEYRSLESGEHIKRTCELTRILINRMKTKPEFTNALLELDLEAVVKASALHDIGKIGIPDNILLKPGKLTDEEYDIIKTHSAIGYDILNSMKFETEDIYIQHCKDISRHHHERWDGTGYPDKLSGNDIPITARIVALVDVYDALVSARCYKPEFSLEKTYKILESSSGTQFQPEIVECFFEVKDEFFELEQKLKEKNL